MSSPTSSERGFPVGLTLAVGVALAILIGLGVWQVQRLKWKTDLLHRIAALQAAPAQPIGPVLARLKAGADVAYSRVALSCPGVETQPTLREFSVHQDRSVWRFGDRAGGDQPIARHALVDRELPERRLGLDAQLGDQAPREVPGQPVSAPVVGVLRSGGERTFVTPPNKPAENQWYWRDVPAMVSQLHAADPAPLFLMLESPSPPSGEPRPAPLPLDIPNNHLGYAITWFGLAAALVGVYLAMLFRKRTS